MQVGQLFGTIVNLVAVCHLPARWRVPHRVTGYKPEMEGIVNCR